MDVDIVRIQAKHPFAGAVHLSDTINFGRCLSRRYRRRGASAFFLPCRASSLESDMTKKSEAAHAAGAGRRKGGRSAAARTLDAAVVNDVRNACVRPLMAAIAAEYRKATGGDYLGLDPDGQMGALMELNSECDEGTSVALRVSTGSRRRTVRFHAGADLDLESLEAWLRRSFAPPRETRGTAETTLPPLMLLNYRFNELLDSLVKDVAGAPARPDLGLTPASAAVQRRMRSWARSLSAGVREMLSSRYVDTLPHEDMEAAACEAARAITGTLDCGDSECLWLPRPEQSAAAADFRALLDGGAVRTAFLVACVARLVSDLVPAVGITDALWFAATGEQPYRLIVADRTHKQRGVLFSTDRDAYPAFRWPEHRLSPLMVRRVLALGDAIWEHATEALLGAPWRDGLDQCDLRNSEAWRKSFVVLFVDAYACEALGLGDLAHRHRMDSDGLSFAKSAHRQMEKRARRWDETVTAVPASALGVETHGHDSRGKRRPRPASEVESDCLVAVARAVSGCEVGSLEEAVDVIDSWKPFRDGGRGDERCVELNGIDVRTKATIFAAVLGADLAV